MLSISVISLISGKVFLFGFSPQKNQPRNGWSLFQQKIPTGNQAGFAASRAVGHLWGRQHRPTNRRGMLGLKLFTLNLTLFQLTQGRVKFVWPCSGHFFDLPRRLAGRSANTVTERLANEHPSIDCRYAVWVAPTGDLRTPCVQLPVFFLLTVWLNTIAGIRVRPASRVERGQSPARVLRHV